MLKIEHTTCHHGQPDPLLHSHGLRRRFHPSHAVQHPSGGKYVDDPVMGEQGSHHSGTEIPYHRTPLGNIVVLTRLHAADLLGIADLADQHPEADLMLDKTFVMYSDTEGVYLHDGECRLIEIPDAPASTTSDPREDCRACTKWLPVDTMEKPIWWVCPEHRDHDEA